MSEPRKNHLNIDGGQIKEDENVATYKPIPDADSDFKAKPTLSKSKEKLHDEAEERLLDKEQEAKIVTRVDMADAKYVVGDHRNGDAKIELDANKRQFSGLTKEELLKYADDPFWVRLRWFMFVLFWALWLCMLAGAIAIIIRAPKCAPPPPKTWYQKGPLVESSPETGLEAVERDLQLLRDAGVEAVFADAGPAYDYLEPDGVNLLKDFVAKAKKIGVKVIVELTPNFVSSSHAWFQKSVNRTAPYDRYFTWASGKDHVNGTPNFRNNWLSTLDTPAWEWNAARGEHYLHQFSADQPDLNFHNPAVVEEFNNVLRAVMKAGADGVRLHKVRLAVVSEALTDEEKASGQGGAGGVDHGSYEFYQHQQTSDQPKLLQLLGNWSRIVDESGSNPGAGETVFTIAEDGSRQELFRARNASMLRPRSAAPVALRGGNASAFVADLNKRLGHWPAVQLKVSPSDEAAEAELALFAVLLPAAPVLRLTQIEQQDTNGTVASHRFSHLSALRDDASVKHGQHALAAIPAVNSTVQLVACARWKAAHTGYMGVFNPASEEARANLTGLPSVPADLTVHHVSQAVHEYTNYTTNAVKRDDVLVPPKSTVVLSYVPLDDKEQ